MSQPQPTSDPGTGTGRQPDPPPSQPPKQPDKPVERQPSAEELAASLAEERKAHRDLQAKFSKLEQQHMSEQDKAIAKAKAEGKAEAIKAAGKRFAAAEFKSIGAEKGVPMSLIDVYIDSDLSRFVNEDGEPDRKTITAVVDKLAAGLPQPDNGAARMPRVPAGPRSEPQPIEQQDPLRAALMARRGG